MFDNDHKNNVAIDIETTGFEAYSEITVFGMLVEKDGARHAHVILNNSGAFVGDHDEQKVVELYDAIKSTSPFEISLSTVMDERILLKEIQSLVFERFEKEYDRFVAYNGETWHGGFDIPYLRSHFNKLNLDWPFSGCDYLDLYPVISKRFNTAFPTEDGDEIEDHNDLVRAHQFLCSPNEEFDPYDDSQQAVEDFREENFEPLVKHNVSDIMRTADLAKVVERYAPPKQMQTDRL